MFVLDEVDKLGGRSSFGDPSAARRRGLPIEWFDCRVSVGGCVIARKVPGTVCPGFPFLSVSVCSGSGASLYPWTPRFCRRLYRGIAVGSV